MTFLCREDGMACLLLQRKEFEFLIAVLAAALLLLVAKANSQCPQGLPLFGDRDPNSPLPDKIQAILPTYTFTCSGPVVQWGACVQPRGNDERYDIYFQVWRSTGEDGCYSIVGSNFVAAGDPDTPRGCIVFDVPEGQRIMVEAGDIMGFYSDHNRNSGGIEVDASVNLDVWFRILSNNPTQSDLEDSSLCIGSDRDLNTFSDIGAPVITAMVDNSQCLLSAPLFGDRNGVPRLPNSIQAIIPAYTFTCRGSVVQWGACVQPRGNNDRYDIYFEVWKPTGTDGCYSLVGSNFVNNGAPGNVHNVRACVVIDVPEDEQVIVEPGDVVGFYSDHVVGNGNGGVELDEGTQYENLEVWYRSISNPSQSDLEANSLCIGVGEDLSTQRTGDAPVITAVIAADCGSLTNPANGSVSLTMTTFDSTASYSCSNSNNLLLGDAVRTCQVDGMWSGTAPVCVVDCGSLQDPENGMVTVTETTFGSIASYSCSGSNYLLVGAAERTCQADGMWSDSAPICVVDCGILPNPVNGTVSVTETTISSTASYSCSGSNYVLMGDAVRTCQADGMWSGSAPTCDLLSSQERSQSLGGIIGGVVAGVLVVIALSVLVALAILYKRRNGSFALRSNVKSRDRTVTQYSYSMENPLYSGVLPQPKVSSLTDTGETVYEDPDCQRSENNYEDPEKMDIYRTMSNVPLIERGHRTLLDTNGHFEWSIYVPTQEQRRSVASSTGRHDNIYAALGEVQMPQDSFFEVSNIYWSPSSDPDELYDQLSINKYREIPRTLIQTTEHLGAGHFGSVEKGIWQTKTGVVEIAVKTLKAGASQGDVVRFLQEAAINGQFQHPNIVELLGVVTVGQPVMIVLELLSNGDLRSYLTRQQPAPGELLPSDTPHMLLQFCKEVASGMEYLSQKAFVHRDLAARNILVASDRTCKISDFGMSRDLENETYYVSHGGKIPVKWTAPEALHFKKYSTASDVWSYGALVYEIWSIGRKPFQSYTNQEAMKLVDSGVRLPPSPGCPKKIYRVMIRCWHPDTSSRPSFTEVVEALSEPEIDLLCWSEEDTAVHPQAAVLGAPLEAGVDLYPELQGTYT